MYGEEKIPQIYFTEKGGCWNIIVNELPAAQKMFFEEISESYTTLKDTLFRDILIPVEEEYPEVYIDGKFLTYSEYKEEEIFSSKESCDWCCNHRGLEENIHGYYQSPWDEKRYTFKLCRWCEEEYLNNEIEGVYQCGDCGREIAENNGMRTNMRYIEEDCCLVCMKCLQEGWFRDGMESFKEGDFFNYKELEENGYTKHESYFCRSDESYNEVGREFDRLQGEGNKVIVDIEASGMGVEHYLEIWVKEEDENA